MSAEFIAVVLIMILFMAFVIVVIFSLSMSAGVRVRKDMLRLLSSYDRIIEVKQQEIDELRKESKQISKINNAKQMPVKETVEQIMPMRVAKNRSTLPASSSYRQKGFFEGYQHIRKYFSMTKTQCDDLVESIARNHVQESMRGEIAARLRSSISDDTVFMLIQLDSVMQLSMLQGALSAEDGLLLKDYLDTLDGDFSVLGFIDYLDDLASLESRIPRMYGPIVGEKSNGICEGIQIRLGNRLYDYSISESEIY